MLSKIFLQYLYFLRSSFSTKSVLFCVILVSLFSGGAIATPNSTQIVGPLRIGVTEFKHGAWKDMGKSSMPGTSTNGWGVTVVVENGTDKESTATIDPAQLWIEDTKGKVCGNTPEGTDTIAHAYLAQLSNVKYSTTWGWKGEAAIVKTFESKGSEVLKIVELRTGTLVVFLDSGSEVGNLTTGSKWQLTMQPRKKVTLVLVFKASAECKPAQLKWPGASTIDLP